MHVEHQTLKSLLLLLLLLLLLSLSLSLSLLILSFIYVFILGQQVRKQRSPISGSDQVKGNNW